MNNKIDYLSIIKEAINVTKNNKTLWWFGLLSLFSGMGASFNYNFPSNSSEQKKFDEMDYAILYRKISFYWENYTEWIILGIVLSLVILVGVYLLGLIGKSALIDSIFKVTKNEKVIFSAGFKRGVGFLKRMFLMNLLFSFFFLIFMFILFFPVVRMFILESYGSAIFLGLVAIALTTSVSIVTFYLIKYAQMYLVGGNLGMLESIKLAYRLFEKNMKESLIMGLVMIAVSFILGMGILFLILLIFIPGGLMGFIAYKLMAKTALIALGLVAGLLVIIGFIFMSAVLNVFSQTIWILFFNQIAKSTELEKVAVVEKVTEIIEDIKTEPNIP